ELRVAIEASVMKNFLRALRCAWPYRYRLGISIICALLAAALWSLSFTTIYPVLTTLGTELTLHDWAEGEIRKYEKILRDKEAERARPAKESRELSEQPASEWRDKRLRELSLFLAKLDADLQSA